MITGRAGEREILQSPLPPFRGIFPPEGAGTRCCDDIVLFPADSVPLRSIENPTAPTLHIPAPYGGRVAGRPGRGLCRALR